MHTEPGWYLPCKTIQEVFMKPVYGLYTLRDREIFTSAFKKALDQAAVSGAQSVLIGQGWKDLLHVPTQSSMEEMLQLLQTRLDDPDCSIKQAIFQAEKSDMYRKVRSLTRCWTRQMARRSGSQTTNS